MPLEKVRGHVYTRVYTPEKWEQVNPKNKDILDDFIKELRAQKKKDGTIQQYYNDLRILMIYVLERCNNQNILELRKRDFRDYMLWLTDQNGVSGARANRLMSACRSLLNFCEDDDEYEYEVNTAAKVKGIPKDPVREIIFLPDDVIMAMYNFAIDHRFYQEATLIALAYESAARKNEIAQVLKESISDKRNATNIVTGKRGKRFPLIYFELTQKAAKLWLKERGEDDVPELFMSKQTGKPLNTVQIYNMIVKMRGWVKDLTGRELLFNVHSFRHSALENYSNGTHHHLIINGMSPIPIEKLKLIARHESIDTTQGYLTPKDDKELEDLFGISLTGE